jgi:TorA maturation chaperone TorD
MNKMVQEEMSHLFLFADILDYPNELSSLTEADELFAYTNPTTYDLEELQAEYIRVFIMHATPLRCVPYASWWIDGRMSGAALSQIDQFYGQCGYKFDAQNMKKPADHISFMIRFIAILAEDGRFQEIAEFARFLNWLEDFADSLSEATQFKVFADAVQNSSRIINSFKENI